MDGGVEILLACITLASCGGSPVAVPATTATSAAPVVALPVQAVAPPVRAATTQPQPTSQDDSFAAHVHAPKLRLGHYSSGDGLTGFVFDRTGTKPKIRMDGASQTIVLEPRPAPLDQTDLVEPGYGVRIRLGRYGEVIYFRGARADSVPVARDADADALP